jgi:hypothetical protein
LSWSKKDLKSKEAGMWNLLRGNQKACRAFREAAEAAASRHRDILVKQDLFTELPEQLRRHSESCEECSRNLDSLLTARSALRGYAPQESFDAPWFAARVMAEICAQERVREGREVIWSAVPRLASRFAGVAALVLILAGGWLIKRPAQKPSSVVTMDSLFDTSQSPATRDDVLSSVLGKAR